ncbi:hypothetical protein VPH35_029778 [Triticum aestivum]|uniref:F-box domain-containing protein n=1 Tax=Triticum turgidum subsp. durum TaxID=4567 RepID=A0A9R1PSU3_TRITD|nr:unnamed protein product [Triticum turgidum subsp. durum]
MSSSETAGSMEAPAEDRISLLPDCLLGTIVSLLPIKEAARTTQLCRRWQSIWPSLPLDLDLNADKSGIPCTGRSISRILSSHRPGAHIRSFSARTRVDETTAGWLQALAHKRIDGSLLLGFAFDGARQLLPLDLLATWSLRCLFLHRCRLVDPRPRAPLTLNHLDSLTLDDVKISETSLHRIIAGCPVLRRLCLSRVRSLRHLVPCSRTLVDVHLALHVPLDKISFRDTPNIDNIVLLCVDVWRLYPNIMAEAGLPSKLPTVHLTLPMLDSPSFAVMPRSSIPIVTTLILHMKFSDCDELSKAAGMLSLFPSLQDLRIWCLSSGSKDKLDACGPWPPAVATTIICLHNHLKHVRLLGYCGTRGEKQFARFLMAGAKALTGIQIIHATNWSHQSINNQRDFICSRGKGSSKAQVIFRRSKTIDKNRRKADSFIRQVPFV